LSSQAQFAPRAARRDVRLVGDVVLMAPDEVAQQFPHHLVDLLLRRLALA
jgi:hypothetical protein